MPHLTPLLAVVLQDAPDRAAALRLSPAARSGSRASCRSPTPTTVIPLEDVVRANLHLVYPERRIEGAWLFRLTRAAELDLSDEDAGNLLQAIEESVGRRALQPHRAGGGGAGDAAAAPGAAALGAALRAGRRRRRGAGAGPGRDRRHARPARAARADGRPGARRPVPAVRGAQPLAGATGTCGRMLRRRDALVYHPYERFADSTARFFADAADDPAVVAIRLTLYRVGERSPIVEALTRALERKKEVAIFVELKARFDETRNVGWVRRLEEAGRDGGVRRGGAQEPREGGPGAAAGGGRAAPLRPHRHRQLQRGDRQGLHRSLALLRRPRARRRRARSLQPAHRLEPRTGRDVPPDRGGARRACCPGCWSASSGRREHARAGRPARIRAKLNGLADTEVIQALYRASRAGRDHRAGGARALHPSSRRARATPSGSASSAGWAGSSSTRGSTTSPTAGEDEYWIGSADWRPRNLRRRVEVVAPVTDAGGARHARRPAHQGARRPRRVGARIRTGATPARAPRSRLEKLLSALAAEVTGRT